MEINLQKYIAQFGICSRRKAGDLIKAGRVFVNGKIAELGMRVGDTDKVVVDGVGVGEKIPLYPPLKKGEEKYVYIKLNKPIGYTCTNRKFKGEKNIFELVGELKKTRLFVVGRLDKNSRGLVLLTNDGDLGNILSHPRYEHEKKYIVKVQSSKFKFQICEAEEIIKKLKRGVEIEEEVQSSKLALSLSNGLKVQSCGEVAKAKEVKYLGNNKFLITLTTGKKRQIRMMFASLGYDVVDLLRVSIGNFELGDLKEGEWEYVEAAQI